MAEFCAECWKEMFPQDQNKKFVVSKYLDLCEGCGEYKRVIIREKAAFFFIRRAYRRFGNFLRSKWK